MIAKNTDKKLSGLLLGYSFICSFYQIHCSAHLKKHAKMACLNPPVSVRGMKKLDRECFIQKVHVPCLKLNANLVASLTKTLKKYTLKLPNFRSIQINDSKEYVDNCGQKKECNEYRKIFLNPKMISSYKDIEERHKVILNEAGVNESDIDICPIQLDYSNWSAVDIFRAVLPENVDSATSFSHVGHIVHVNLREHLLEFKNLIGEVLLDKVVNARTVVNKVDTIDNTFRVFNMEVLAGESDFLTEVRENNSQFKFDFSSVYWNPRLCTEHERIVKKLNPGEILYDVFAGVGPFSIPAAKKKCTVLANDLNPDSFKWLNYNVKLNKVESKTTTYNKDGGAFIKEDVKENLLKNKGKNKSHVVMNLPSIAASFLSAFKQLFTSEQLKEIEMLPLVHVYCFIKDEVDSKHMAQEMIENELNCSITDALDEVIFVRKVAPNKDMMRVSFQLTNDMILINKRKLGIDFDLQDLKKTKS